MFIIVLFALLISFGWYMVDDVYGKQPLAPVSQSDFETHNAASTPELTKDRIDLLRLIAAEDRLPSTISSNESNGTSNSDPLANLNAHQTDFATIPVVTSARIEQSSVSEWESYQGNVTHSGAKEGMAFSGWTTLSPSPDWSDNEIQASLVASCNDEGERSLYIRISSSYPGFEAVPNVNSVNGLVGWDSSEPYSAPFTYDAELNALRLRAGLEDSLSMIRDGNKVTIQIPWNENPAAFEFSLKGSSLALKTTFDYCLSETS